MSWITDLYSSLGLDKDLKEEIQKETRKIKTGLGGSSKKTDTEEGLPETAMSFIENIKKGPLPEWADGMGFNPVTKSIRPIARSMKEDPLKNYKYEPKNTEYVSFEEERSGKGLGVRKPRSVVEPDTSFVANTGKYKYNFKEDSKLKNSVLNRLAFLENIETKAYPEKGGGFSIGIGDNDPSYTKDSITTVKDAVQKFRDFDFDKYLQRTKDLFPDFDNMPRKLQVELYQARYRGDFNEGDKSVALINAGRYEEAAKEFLNNADYIEKERKLGRGGWGG